MSEPLVGGQAFKEMLSSIDVDDELRRLIEEVKVTKSVSKRDGLVKRIKFLAGLQKNEMKPDEAFLLKYMPVVPPITRPPTVTGGNSITYPDVNMLYKDHMVVNNALKPIVDIYAPEDLVVERQALYDGAKAVMGLGEQIKKGKPLRGLLKQVGGVGGPKTGFFHNRMLSKKQDFSGRATIYAEPNIGFNEVAAPVDMLWTLYKFHMLRDLAKTGYNYVDALKAWTDRTPAAKTSFSKMIKQVPIILNRPPTLMKSNVTAHFPVPIQGSSLGINPLHLPLYAGDFDGDALTIHLPITPEAVEEAKQKLLPQNQIYDYRRGVGNSLIMPGHEAIVGSLHMTEPDKNQKVHEFESEEAVLEALKNGHVTENTPIKIVAHK